MDSRLNALAFIAQPEESVTKIDRRDPRVMKQGYAKSWYTKFETSAKGLYAKYEPKAEQCAVSAWRKLNQLPLFPQVASVLVPTAAYCSDMYNQTVVNSAEKGRSFLFTLPRRPLRPSLTFSSAVSDVLGNYISYRFSGNVGPLSLLFSVTLLLGSFAVAHAAATAK
ncbi:hypothetical protein Godav_012443 [Gossypium davidsonii]|uniref:Uncharacterized protein n=1 Tax=Gossypium davidsonii TaxID=34287 RepID=A0A7J8REJ2_GOSDV|nr:hypothetical protein [Gossypium davidsonii]